MAGSNQPVTKAGTGAAATGDERTIGVPPRFSPRQQSGIGQQSGDAMLDASSAREQQGRLSGMPRPESNPIATNRTTERLATS
jgi:hypothetical protein